MSGGIRSLSSIFHEELGAKKVLPLADGCHVAVISSSVGQPGSQTRKFGERSRKLSCDGSWLDFQSLSELRNGGVNVGKVASREDLEAGAGESESLLNILFLLL